MRVLKSLSELCKVLDEILLTEAAIEMFLENSRTFYERQIILLNIVLEGVPKLKISTLFRQAKQIKSS